MIAYLNYLDLRWREQWRLRVSQRHSPEDKLLGIFDLAIAEQAESNFRGCHFSNAAAEYPIPETETEFGIIAAAKEHRRWLFETMTQLISDACGYPGGSQARQMLVFLDGGLTGARLERSTEPLIIAKSLAKGLLSEPPADYCI